MPHQSDGGQTVEWDLAYSLAVTWELAETVMVQIGTLELAHYTLGSILHQMMMIWLTESETLQFINYNNEQLFTCLWKHAAILWAKSLTPKWKDKYENKTRD